VSKIKGQGPPTRQLAIVVHHYFSTKDRLFLTALAEPVDPSGVLTHIFAGPVETLGERLVARFLALWEDGAGESASALLRTAVTSDHFAQLVREKVFPVVVGELITRVGVDPGEAAARAVLVASHLSGLVTTRYVLRLEPMAGAPIDWVAAAIGPSVQCYLTGALPSPPSRESAPGSRDGANAAAEA
jgi:AcrR family transcriptional regulator